MLNVVPPPNPMPRDALACNRLPSPEAQKPQPVTMQFGHHVGVGPTREQALSQIRSKSYAHILGHEQAHANAAGHLAGPIQINYNADGIAVAGSVPVHFGLNPAEPEASYADAQRARAAAFAPSDPSAGDFAVAARAASIMGQAQILMQQKQRQQQAQNNIVPAVGLRQMQPV